MIPIIFSAVGTIVLVVTVALVARATRKARPGPIVRLRLSDEAEEWLRDHPTGPTGDGH